MNTTQTFHSVSARFCAGAALLVIATLLPTPAMAQDLGGTAQQATTQFTPTLFIVGSTTNNELRDVNNPVAESSFYSEADLPFVFRGKRMSGGFSINPAWRQYRELEELNQFEAGVSGWLSGELGPRTQLNMVVGGAYSSQLTALDTADIITPRTRRTRSRGSASIQHRLNSRGDALDFSFDYDGTDYLDGEFVSQRSFGLLAGYARAIDARLSLSLSGRIDRIQYDNGNWINTGTPLLGFNYRLGPRTDLDVRGGLSLSQQGGPDALLADQATSQTVALSASLRHRGDNWSMGLSGSRRVASGVAIGAPTLRTQLLGILGWQDARWRLGVSAGVASNKRFDDQSGSIILTPEGFAVTEADEIRTVTSCAGVAFRALDWMSVVGAGRFGLQRPVGVTDALDLDVYRVSVGIALHPHAPAINTAGGAAVLSQYGRAGSFGSC